MAKEGDNYGAVAQAKPRTASSKAAPSTVQVHLALLLAYVLWGCGAIVGKLGVAATNPLIFEFWREAIISVLMLIGLPAVGIELLPERADLPRLLLGSFGYFANQLFWFVGIKMGDPIIGSTWQTFLPILTMMVAAIMGQEVLNWEKALGILIAAAGAAFMVLYDSRRMYTQSHDTARIVLGHGLFFLNIAGISMYFLLFKSLGKKYNQWMLVAWSNFVGSTLMFALAAILHLELAKPVMSMICKNSIPSLETECSENWLISAKMIYPLAFEIICCSLIALTLLNWANKHTEASVVTVYNAVHAVTSTLLSLVLVLIFGHAWGHRYGIRMPGYGTLGTALVVIGLVNVFRYDRKQAQLSKGLIGGGLKV